MTKNVFILGILLMLSITSCSTNDDEPQNEKNMFGNLIFDYNAVVVDMDNNESLSFENLPVLSLPEANSILREVSDNKNSGCSDTIITTEDETGKHSTIQMNNSFKEKYKFSISFLISTDKNGNLFYNGYKNECKSDKFAWDVELFSFATCLNSYDECKFYSESYIVMKIYDNGYKLLKIPYAIKGTFNKNNFTVCNNYTL